MLVWQLGLNKRDFLVDVVRFATEQQVIIKRKPPVRLPSAGCARRQSARLARSNSPAEANNTWSPADGETCSNSEQQASRKTPTDVAAALASLPATQSCQVVSRGITGP